MQDAEQKRKPKILIICNYYLPGYKAGGGLRTLVNMVERFRERFDFRIITLDHDGDNVSYDSVKINQWNDLGGTQVFYLARNSVKLSKLRELIKTVEPNAIYLNSIFSTLTIFVLILRKLKLFPKINIILAPEGELSEGALQLKAFRKKTFMSLSRQTALYKDLIWKATADPEKREVENFKGSGGTIFVAPNMPAKYLSKDYKQELKPKKKIGEAKMIFLSRLARKKNLGWLIENLKDVKEKLEVDIYGPIEDEVYWDEIEKSIKNLPENIKVEYKGIVAYENVSGKLFEYQFFILPTLGENFGHVFIEALAAGCPLIMSDRTPWLNLKDKGIGWDIALESRDKWNEVFNYCINLDDFNYSKLSSNARAFAISWLNQPEIEENTLDVLNYSLGIKNMKQAKESAKYV